MKDSKIKNITIIVLVLIIIGLISYLIYNKYNTKNCTINDNIIINNGTYNHKLENRKTIQKNEIDWISIINDTKGDIYLLCNGNIETADKSIKNNLKNIENKYQKYAIDKYSSYDGSSKELSALKLDINKVLSVYTTIMGNGGSKYFIFVKENGTISYLSYDDIIYNGKVDIVNVKELDNVVSIVNNYYDMTPYAIKSDGSEVSLYDYIK